NGTTQQRGYTHVRLTVTVEFELSTSPQGEVRSRRYCVLSESAKRMRSVLYRAGCHGCKAKILCAEQIRSPLWEEIRSVPEGYSFLLKKWYNITKDTHHHDTQLLFCYGSSARISSDHQHCWNNALTGGHRFLLRSRFETRKDFEELKQEYTCKSKKKYPQPFSNT
ncbi:MAG: hypothetical protein UY87_C0022G0011, partial [Candidatus Peribacteria bacterium GW2011_GWC2_54_8]